MADQVARRAEARRRFPRLVEASPQPTGGVGVFLALPAWHINQAIVCVDAREIDGRLFAAPSPAYIDYQSCLVIACLPEIPSLQAWLGFEGAQVDEEVRHVTDGTTLFLTTSDRAPQPQDSLGQNLLFRERWSFADLTGPVRGVETYCLVAGGDQILYCDGFRSPFQYRQRMGTGSPPLPSVTSC